MLYMFFYIFMRQYTKNFKSIKPKLETNAGSVYIILADYQIGLYNTTSLIKNIIYFHEQHTHE